FRLEVPGLAAHGAHRDRGVSAVELFAQLHADLLGFEAERQRDPDPRFAEARFPYGLSVGRVAAGDWASSVPDLLVAEGRYGVRVEEDLAAARAELEQALAEAADRDGYLRDHPPVVSWSGGQFAGGHLPPGPVLRDEV